jgi:hypothetical protein
MKKSILVFVVLILGVTTMSSFNKKESKSVFEKVESIAVDQNYNFTLDQIKTATTQLTFQHSVFKEAEYNNVSLVLDQCNPPWYAPASCTTTTEYIDSRTFRVCKTCSWATGAGNPVSVFDCGCTTYVIPM